jgi:hypothetical protein
MSARPPNHQDILSLFLLGATKSSWACYSHLGPRPKFEHMPQEDGEHLRDVQGRPPPWPPP